MGRVNQYISFCLHKPFALNCGCRVYFFCCSCSQTGEEDVSQFDSKFTRQTPVDSPVDSMLSESADKIFQVKEIKTVDLVQRRVRKTLQPFSLYAPHSLKDPLVNCFQSKISVKWPCPIYKSYLLSHSSSSYFF